MAGSCPVGSLDAGSGFALSEPEAFQAGVHRAHMEGGEGRRRRANSGGERGVGGQRRRTGAEVTNFVQPSLGGRRDDGVPFLVSAHTPYLGSEASGGRHGKAHAHAAESSRSSQQAAAGKG